VVSPAWIISFEVRLTTSVSVIIVALSRRYGFILYCCLIAPIFTLYFIYINVNMIDAEKNRVQIDVEIKAKLNECDIVWFGEVHGVIENYSVYMIYLPILRELGFSKLLWEMSDYFWEKTARSEDGRINPQSIEFYYWLKGLESAGSFDVSFIGEREINDHESYDKWLAKEIAEKTNGRKTILISGNYHAGCSREGNNASSIIVERYNKKICRICLEYKKGFYYNFGTKKFPESDSDSRPYFIESKDKIKSSDFSISIDEARAV